VITPMVLALLTTVVSDPAMRCASLKSLVLANATVTAAESVPAGPLSESAGGGRAGRGSVAAQPTVPAHCRVAVVLTPSPDSHIEIEVWLPLENWNGKFQAVGNGGWAGVISYAAMANALQNGYATASTDTGHKGGSGAFAVGHPEKLIDFGYRSMHEMVVRAKGMVTTLYGQPPRLSYYNGCSTGGRQGLMEAQRLS
jgi:feruloyl esterase